MQRYELTDDQWVLIEDLFPPERGKGRPYRGHRSMVNAMMWILNTGSPWRDLPDRFGPWKTAYNRFNRWRNEGLFDRILERLQVRLDEESQVDWDRGAWMVRLSARTSRQLGGAKGATASRPTTHWGAQEAVGELRCTWLLTARALR